ncbi:hypothetical protein ACIO52_04580 [Nocardia sp. NPDC087230]|uniref:hypothetical protein n=1 Tax=Nocardia sp. NPDC087230 TaxID=3364331 RepID=UPI00381E854D
MAVESTMPATAVADVDQADLAPVIPLRPVRPEFTIDQTDTAARIAALEARIADLKDRNRELASDLDDALDQLAGHALHDHQERLVRTPVNAFAAIEWEGHDR